jgi:uncharacterized Zn finger protein
MSWYGDYGGWAPYVSVATKIARGRAAAKKLATKEKREPDPIAIQGRKIAKTFWGLKWCENLERYRDISNRLPRGATYVRNGSVADLLIEPGSVRAIVGGSEAYTVKITIQTLRTATWKAICGDCARAIDSLFDLLQGRFSDGVMQRLTDADKGLFPHKNEISMTCSCPDSAGVCKHIAATFYGVAARLDQRPELLFKLRNVDHLELIAHATDAANLDQALSGSGEALSDADLGDIFGIELESKAASSSVTARRASKRPAHSKPAKASAAASTTNESRGLSRRKGEPKSTARAVQKTAGKSKKQTAKPSTKRASKKVSSSARRTKTA